MAVLSSSFVLPPASQSQQQPQSQEQAAFVDNYHHNHHHHYNVDYDHAHHVNEHPHNLHHHHHGHHDTPPFPQPQGQQKGGQVSSSLNSCMQSGNSDADEILLQTLCAKGLLDEALHVLCRMETSPCTTIYMSILKACNKNKALNQAKRVHAHLLRHCTQLTDMLGGYLVMTLAKCGAVDDAREISDRLGLRSVFSWTALISAYAECGRGHEALKLHQYMQEDGVEPDSYTFVSLFKACGSIPDLGQGKKLHDDARMKGFTSNVFVGNSLVSMYGKCGAVVEAEEVFAALSQPDVVSWNSMLSAYVEQGQGEKALGLYRQVQEEGMSPNQLTLMFALQACAILSKKEEASVVQGQSYKLVALEIGQALHAIARMKDFAMDVFVGTAILSMYGKCGAIVEAEDAFSALSECDIVSWTALLSAYVEHDQGEKALQLYRHMQEGGVSPNQQTFVVALQACATIAEKEAALVVDGQSTKANALQIGQAIHTDAHSKDFASDAFVATALLSMYGKCGSIVEAENVFHELSRHDIISWNVMLSVYVDHGKGEKALLLYRQMQNDSRSPDSHTLMFALQACATLADREEPLFMEGQSTKMASLEIGQALHCDAGRKKIFANDTFVGTALLSMYSKCGTIWEVENVFGALAYHDVVSWNVMLSACVERGQGDKALQLYRQMQWEGVSPDQHTFMIAIHACAILAEKEETLFVDGQPIKVMSLKIGQALHADACTKDFASDAFVGTALLSMYGKCGAIQEAEDVFCAFPERDIVSWTAMLSAYVEQGQGDKVLWLFREMQKECVTLDDRSLTCILQACTEPGSLETCKQLHFDITSAGYDMSPSVATTLIHVYGCCASMADAQAVFDGLSEPDIVSWNVCIAGYAGEGNSAESLHILEKMKLAGINPDEVTSTSVLLACCHTGLVFKGLEYFDSMSRDYSITSNINHYGIMVDLLGRAGDFRRLETVLGRMPMQADLTIWLCLLRACRTHDNLDLAERLFDHAVNIQPEQAAAYILMSNIFVTAGLLEGAAEAEVM